MSHTPGPWRLRKCKNECYAKVDADKWTGFARIVIRMRSFSFDNMEGLANANLIAAAPDLLSAVEDALHHHIEFGGLHNDTVLKLKAAIEKAKGT